MKQSSHSKQKSFHHLNLTVDEVTKFYKTENQSDTEHSISESYSDTDKKPQADRNYAGNVEVVRCPAK
jgi:hypothetical protein